MLTAESLFPFDYYSSYFECLDFRINHLDAYGHWGTGLAIGAAIHNVTVEYLAQCGPSNSPSEAASAETLIDSTLLLSIDIILAHFSHHLLT